VSLIAGIPVRHDIAMTGELILRGKVLPIGGLKEKLLATARAGITTALIPAANAPELTEIPPHVTAKLTIKPIRTMDEILEIALPHLESAPRAMLSFGQGCEGEPLLQADLMVEVIRKIREQTKCGTLHLNSNGSRPRAVERLFAAGLDSIRVSTNSARAAPYHAYYRPVAYSFDDVVESLRVARRANAFASINYLAFPGFTDGEEEDAARHRLIGETRLDLIQWRNLNIDPDAYADVVGIERGAPKRGMRRLLAELRAAWPRLRHGYLNPSREAFAAAAGLEGERG